MNLTKEQRRRIYCVKYGHAKFVTLCFGYVHCGRCGEQIGDRLANIFDLKGYLVVGHKKSCPNCLKVRKELTKMDLRILEKLEEKENV